MVIEQPARQAATGRPAVLERLGAGPADVGLAGQAGWSPQSRTAGLRADELERLLHQVRQQGVEIKCRVELLANPEQRLERVLRAPPPRRLAGKQARLLLQQRDRAGALVGIVQQREALGGNDAGVLVADLLE